MESKSPAGKNEPDALRPILMRSSTPATAASEKVLLYLESMSQEEMISNPESSPPTERGYDDDTPSEPGRFNPRSPRGSVLSPRTGGSAMGKRPEVEHRGVNGGVTQDNDLDSNAQDRGGSLAGDHKNGAHEPGPGDEPGPRYISYGSGPSFGNFGTLRDSRFDAFHNTPAHAAQIALPGSVASPRSASINIQVDPPSSSSRSRTAKTIDRADRDDATVTGNQSHVRAASRAPTEVDGRPLSPRSHVSRGPSQMSGATQKVNGYGPPNGLSGGVVDNSTKHLSKTPSIAPSDSPSNFKGNGNGTKANASHRAMSPSRMNGGGADQSPRGQPRDIPPYQNGVRSHMSGMSGNPSRAFSPYKHAPTSQDLFYAMSPTQLPQQPSGQSQLNGGQRSVQDPDPTPTPSRPQSPLDLDPQDEQKLRDFMSNRLSRTSMAFSNLESEVQNSHFHDMELCVLLHALDDSNLHDVMKKTVQKAVRQRVKKLGLKYDNESIKQYRKSHHDHEPDIHLEPNYPSTQEPPDWAKELMQNMIVIKQRLEGLSPLSKGESYIDDTRSYPHNRHYTSSELEQYGQTPMTQTVNIQTQPTGTVDSMFQPAGTEIINQSTRHDEVDYEDDIHRDYHGQDTETRPPMSEFMVGRDDSPGQQFLEEELYKLRVKPGGSQSAVSHKTWEVARDGGEYEEDPDGHAAITESGLPEIPDGNTGVYTDGRKPSPPLPPTPPETRRDMVPMTSWQAEYGSEPPIPPWKRIHQRLLSWAIVWPISEFDNALNSTTRGRQVDEVALSIWSTQTYKRYVRSKMTDSPQAHVDRLFVPPNMADAISNAVYNGRHGDACAMLRDLWTPFGLEGMPRLLIVLAKHRSDENHWVVHRFSLPDGSLTTYDTFPERCLPDGRPLGWWFAIRVAWPNAIYPPPDRLMQKMVRLHRPLQLAIDNSVAAAGIWRNLLMGSRAERGVDLERLRDLMNTEVKNLRQRKQMGKLSISPPQPNWEDMN